MVMADRDVQRFFLDHSFVFPSLTTKIQSNSKHSHSYIHLNLCIDYQERPPFAIPLHIICHYHLNHQDIFCNYAC